MQLLLEAIEQAGFTPGDDIAIALDPASTEFFDDGTYAGRRGPRRSAAAEMVELWPTSCERYPIVSIEDGMAEEDWDGWTRLTDALGEPGAARRRRPVRHQHRAPGAGASTPASPTRS